MVPPYNTLSLFCNASLPLPPSQLNATLTFTWLKDSEDVTSSSSSTTLTSVLTREENVTGSFSYTCRYSVVVLGDDPYTAEASAAITVTSKPL